MSFRIECQEITYGLSSTLPQNFEQEARGRLLHWGVYRMGKNNLIPLILSQKILILLKSSEIEPMITTK